MESGVSRQLGGNRRELRAKDGRFFSTRSAPTTSESELRKNKPSKEEDSRSRKETSLPQESQFLLFHVDRFYIRFNKVESEHCIVVDIINYLERNGQGSFIKRHVSLD